MKRVMLAVAAALLIASCTSKSGERRASLKKRVVREMYLDSNQRLIMFPNKEIKYLDSSYVVGDTVLLINEWYLIIK